MITDNSYKRIMLIATIVTAVAAVVIIPVTCSEKKEKSVETIENNCNADNTSSIPAIYESDTSKILNTNKNNKVFSVKSINNLDENTTFVIIQLVGSDTASDVKVRVSEMGICRIQNEHSFPIKKMSRNETFEVELVRKSFTNENLVKISIEWDDFDGHQRDIKEVDVRAKVEIDSR